MLTAINLLGYIFRTQGSLQQKSNQKKEAKWLVHIFLQA